MPALPRANDTPAFGVSQYTTPSLSFEQDIEVCERVGVDGLEVLESKLSTDPGRAREQLAMLRDSNLNLVSVQPNAHSPFPHIMTPPDQPREPLERMPLYARMIDLFSECFPDRQVTMVSTSGAAPDSDFARAHREARDYYRRLADYAAERNVRIGQEPLSGVYMNQFTFIWTLDEALQMIHDVDRPNFGLYLDVFHIWREPLICERIAALGDRLFGVHICDWPRGEMRHMNDRVLPGDGQIDLSALCAAIERTGYDGAYCLEIFSDESLPDSLWTMDPAEVLRRGMEGFRTAWRERGKRKRGW